MLPPGLDNVLVYVYDGAAVVGGEAVPAKNVVRFEPKDSAGPTVLSLQAAPGVEAVAEDRGFGTGHATKMLLFAGKKLNEPIAWHGCVSCALHFSCFVRFVRACCGKACVRDACACVHTSTRKKPL